MFSLKDRAKTTCYSLSNAEVETTVLTILHNWAFVKNVVLFRPGYQYSVGFEPWVRQPRCKPKNCVCLEHHRNPGWRFVHSKTCFNFLIVFLLTFWRRWFWCFYTFVCFCFSWTTKHFAYLLAWQLCVFVLDLLYCNIMMTPFKEKRASRFASRLYIWEPQCPTLLRGAGGGLRHLILSLLGDSPIVSVTI